MRGVGAHVAQRILDEQQMVEPGPGGAGEQVDVLANNLVRPEHRLDSHGNPRVWS